ncbi:hypothetical protein EHS39_26125 [Ensifer sp. MPMI2T]|nr:hypothetical protein EHS39_26125 [Ensifer sp. MPMI2T]
MSLALEKTWPYALSGLVAAIWWLYLDKPFPSNAGDLLGATGNVSAVLVGFLITAKAIVLSLTNTPVFTRLAETGYNKVFFNYIYEAEVAGILLLVCSIAGFFAMSDQGLTPTWFQVAWVSACLLTISLFFRVVTMIFSFLKQI